MNEKHNIRSTINNLRKEAVKLINEGDKVAKAGDTYNGAVLERAGELHDEAAGALEKAERMLATIPPSVRTG